MRNLRLLALLAPVLLSPLACEDSSSSSGGTFNPEAGPGFEAGPLPDAEPLDAGLDAIAPATGVNVTVVKGTAPQKDVRVILHDSAGAVIGDVKTDAAGKVVIATAPSMVTVLGTRFISDAILPQLVPTTFQGVTDGDNLLVDISDVSSGGTPAGEYSVSFAAPFGGTSVDYLASVGNCVSTTTQPATPLLLPVDASCVSAQNSVLASARDANQIDLAFGFAKNLAKPGATPLAVGPLSFTARGLTKVTAANIPVGGSRYGELLAISNGASFFSTITGGALDAGDLTFATATGFAEAYQASVTTQVFTTGTNRRTLIRREATTAPASATLAFDFASALPSITNVVVDRMNVARPKVTLSSSAPFASADGAVVALGWFPSDGPDARWTFIVPPTTTTITVPALPADASAYTPNGTSNVPELAFVESSLLPGYAELKKLPISAGELNLADTSMPLPLAGTVRITHWDPID